MSDENTELNEESIIVLVDVSPLRDDTEVNDQNKNVEYSKQNNGEINNKIEDIDDDMDIEENNEDYVKKSIKYDDVEHAIDLENLDKFDNNMTPRPLNDTLYHHSMESRGSWLKSNESIFVQENPDGETILRGLFEKVSTQKLDEYSEYSAYENTVHTESADASDPLVRRSELINKLKEANNERKGLMSENKFYQSRLLEYFRMVKVKQTVRTKQSSEKESLMDFSTQYLRYGEMFLELMNIFEASKEKYNEKIAKMKSACMEKNDFVQMNINQFHKIQENVGLSALHSRTGNKLDPNIIYDYLQSEMKKENKIKIVRLENLKLEHKNDSIDKAMKSQESSQTGLRLIDFEQLKIENQTFNEKVEDREEAINKLHEKITKCNHLISHIKEKISLTEYDKKSSRIESIHKNREFKKLQKQSSKAKKIRDNIKLNNRQLQMSCGLLGKKDYLRCYENINEETDNLRDKLLGMEFEKNNILLKNSKLIHNINENKSKKK